MPAKYVIAIPSYKRAELLRDKTLAMLNKAGIKNNIFIFVADEEEREHYDKVIPKSLYSKIIVGRLGIAAQRQFIMNFFPKGTCVVSIDDDVECLYKLEGDKMVVFNDIDSLFTESFDYLKKNRLQLFGVFPTPNPFYMKGQKETSTTLKFIIGTLHGFINTKDPGLVSNLKEKEDVELTIASYIKYGGVYRHNNISFKTKFKNANGGLGGIQSRFDANREAAEYLHAKYPEYTRIKVRKNGMYEIVLRAPRTK